MASINPLLQLRIDVHRHLRVGVADLPHDPLDVEVVGEEGDRDVGAAQAVGGRVGQWWQALGDEPFAGLIRGVADDLADPLATEAAAVEIRHQVVARPGWDAHPPQAVEVLDDGLDQVGAHLHLADAGLGLRVGDPEPCPVGIVEAELTDLQIAELAGAHAASPEDLADDAAADVAAADLRSQLPQVVADGRLGDVETLGDLGGAQAFRGQVSDQRRGGTEVG